MIPDYVATKVRVNWIKRYKVCVLNRHNLLGLLSGWRSIRLQIAAWLEVPVGAGLCQSRCSGALTGAGGIGKVIGNALELCPLVFGRGGMFFGGVVRHQSEDVAVHRVLGPYQRKVSFMLPSIFSKPCAVSIRRSTSILIWTSLQLMLKIFSLLAR